MANIKNWFNAKTLIGDAKNLVLEERIFNTFCIIAFIAMVVEVPFNFYIGLIVTGWICIFGVFFSAFLYYISRVKRKSRLGIYLFSIVCNITFTLNYFYNSGIFGPNLLLFGIAFMVIISIIPKEHFKIWVPINILVVFIVLVYEFYYPIASIYESELAKTIDFGVTYLVMVLIMYYGIAYIRKNYDAERVAVLKKNVEIEAQHKRISEQKLALEKSNSEKNKLFSIVSHDIRAPLSSIQGYLEILTVTELSDEERINIKQRLLQVTRDTSDMITNLLVWSKSQLDGTHIDLTSISINDFLAKSLNVEKDISLKKGVELIIESEKNLQFIADKNMLQIVLRNLINNAIKFTPQNGTIKVTAFSQNDNCVIKVSDNGLGVPANVKSQLFKLKATSTYGTNNEKGIGLGLLLCKEFTELQGGQIWYEDTAEQGSVFVVAFLKS